MTKLITIFDKDLNQRVFRLFYENEIIHKIDTSITISSSKSSIDVGENVILSGVLSDAGGNVLSGKNVRILKNNVLVDTVTTDSNGAYSKTISGLSAGTYHFHASFAGDDTYDNALSSTIDVNVLSHVYVVTLLSDKQSILSSESVTLSGTVTRDGEGYAGQSVRLFDGVTLVDTLTTDSSGNFSKTLSNLSVGTHSLFAQFDAYESSIVVVEVQDHDYAINISADNPIIQTGDTAIITATLMDGSNPVVGETLSYSLTNKGTVVGSGSTTTNNNGEISITYVGAGLGDIDVEVSYGTLLQKTYELQDCRYWNDNEVSVTGSNKHTLYDPNLSVSLPTNAEISFDVSIEYISGNKDYRWWFSSKSLINGMNYPNNALFFDKKPSYILYNQQANGSTKYSSSKRFSASEYANIKYVKNETSVEVYVDDVFMFEDTVSWIDNYTDYTISMMKWSGNELIKMKNVKIKNL